MNPENRPNMYCLSRSFCLAVDSDMRPALFILDRGSTVRLEGWVYEVLLQLGSTRLFDGSEFRTALQAEKGLSDEECAALLSQLCALGVIWQEDTLSEWEAWNAAEDLSWEKCGWVAAKLFHDSVAYSTFLQGDPDGWREQLRAMEELTAESEGPPPVRTLPAHLPTVELEPPSGPPPSVSFFHMLTARRTMRSFTSERPISRATLGEILYYAAKAQRQYQSRHFGLEIRRTSPSGGSRHPVELYPQVFDSTEGLDGSYYYHSLHHSLIRLGDVTKTFIDQISQRQLRIERNFVVFLVTARFIRNYWKYRYPKSYAFTLLDVGHFVQTLILVCEALRLKCFLTPALDVRKVQQHLQLPNIYDECPVYFVAAGYPADEPNR